MLVSYKSGDIIASALGVPVAEVPAGVRADIMLALEQLSETEYYSSVVVEIVICVFRI